MIAQKSSGDMIKTARQEIENLSPQQAQVEIANITIAIMNIRVEQPETAQK